MALLGGCRTLAADGNGVGVFLLVSLMATCALWWFTAWFMLLGQVRWRVLTPSGLITGLAMWGYAMSATIWMPGLISRNDTQFGFFGVALALVTWLSGAALCVLVGACAGPVLAEDNGPVGALLSGAGRTSCWSMAPYRHFLLRRTHPASVTRSDPPPKRRSSTPASSTGGDAEWSWPKRWS